MLSEFALSSTLVSGIWLNHFILSNLRKQRRWKEFICSTVDSPRLRWIEKWGNKTCIVYHKFCEGGGTTPRSDVFVQSPERSTGLCNATVYFVINCDWIRQCAAKELELLNKLECLTHLGGPIDLTGSWLEHNLRFLVVYGKTKVLTSNRKMIHAPLHPSQVRCRHWVLSHQQTVDL